MCPEASFLHLSPAEIHAHDFKCFKGHTTSITCLYIPDPIDCLNKKYLFSASEDGTVIIWNIE